MLKSLAVSLALTLILEIACALILGLRSRRALLTVGLVNTVTNPSVVLTLNLIALVTHAPAPWYCIAGLELAVLFAEALLFRLCLIKPPVKPIFLSLIFNTVSYLGGLLLS